MKKSEFVQKSVKHMSVFNRSIRAEQFPIKPKFKTFNEADEYETHVCRNGWEQIYRVGEKRRERV